MEISRSWFPGVDSMFCILQILQWHGGSVDPGYLNYLLIRDDDLTSDIPVDACCEKVGLSVSICGDGLRLELGDTYLGIDTSGRYLAILIREPDFFLYSPAKGHSKFPLTSWRVPNGFTFFVITKYSPLRIPTKFAPPNFSLVTKAPAHYSTINECILSRNMSVSLPVLPTDWPKLVKRRMQEMFTTLMREKMVSPDLVKFLHRNVSAGIIYEIGEFRDIHLARCGTIFVHPSDICELVDEWCSVATKLLPQSRDKTSSGVLIAAQLMSDFICIHPFSDHNGKVSLLLLAWLLGDERALGLPELVGKRTYYAAMYAAGNGDFTLSSSAIEYTLQLNLNVSTSYVT